MLMMLLCTSVCMRFFTSVCYCVCANLCCQCCCTFIMIVVWHMVLLTVQYCLSNSKNPAASEYWKSISIVLEQNYCNWQRGAVTSQLWKSFQLLGLIIEKLDDFSSQKLPALTHFSRISNPSKCHQEELVSTPISRNHFRF